jgi:hypothetical protein
MSAVIFTFSSIRNHPGTDRLIRSCRKHGWHVDYHTGEFSERGIWEKFIAMLPQYRSEGFKFALRLDSWDVIALGPPAELIPRMVMCGNPALLMAAECAIWPTDYPRGDQYPTKDLPTPWKYAHSPVVIDLFQETPEAFLKMPEEKLNRYGGDQWALADMIIDRVPGVAIDTDCRVVQSLAHCPPHENFLVTEDRIYNRLTKSYPLFAHGNGRAAMEWIPGGILV